MPTTNNNFFVYIGDNWEQINPDFTNEVEYLQQLIVILNNKIDKLTDNLEAVNSYTEIKNKIINLLKEKLKYYICDYPLPDDCYELGKLASVIKYNNMALIPSYYIDNQKGNDSNTGYTLFKPRKTLPNTLEDERKVSGIYLIRLLDSTQTYYIEDLVNSINDKNVWTVIVGNSLDNTQVKLESKTENYTEITPQLTIMHTTINNNLYLSPSSKINFVNIQTDGQIHINNGTVTTENLTQTNGTFIDNTNPNIILEDNATYSTSFADGAVTVAPTGNMIRIKDFDPLPNSTQISNLEELNTLINYLKTAINTDNTNIDELIDSIPDVNPYIDNLTIRIVDYLYKQFAGNQSILYQPITLTDYSTNEVLGELDEWYNGRSLANVLSDTTTVRNVKVAISNLFELILEITNSTNYTASTFRTLLNNNKISGLDMPSSTNVYNASNYSTGGEYQIPLPTDFKLENKGTQFNIANTDTAEFRFGYDNNDNNTQNYIQMLMTEDTITFNEVNGATTTPLTTFTLPDTTTTSKVIKWSLYARKDKTLNIIFNDETYETTLNQAISNPYLYINIPSNSTSLRRVTGTTAAQGITITEYPTRII